jgi:hypothetical protein
VGRKPIAVGCAQHFRGETFILSQQAEYARRSADTIADLSERLGDRARPQFVKMLGTSLETGGGKKVGWHRQQILAAALEASA